MGGFCSYKQIFDSVYILEVDVLVPSVCLLNDFE